MRSTHLGIQELRETVLFVLGLVWTLASLLFFSVLLNHSC